MTAKQPPQQVKCDSCGNDMDHHFVESKTAKGSIYRSEWRFACRTCRRQARLIDGKPAYKGWIFSECVACGRKTVVASPSCFNNHQCPPEVEAGRKGAHRRAEEGEFDQEPTVHDRLKYFQDMKRGRG